MSFIVTPYPLDYSYTYSHYPVYTSSYYNPLYATTSALGSALRRSRIENQYRRDRLIEGDLRRSRLEAELANVRLQAESTLRRSRAEAEVALSNIYTDNLLRRSRLSYEIEKAAAETALRNSRVTSELIASQVQS